MTNLRREKFLDFYKLKSNTKKERKKEGKRAGVKIREESLSYYTFWINKKNRKQQTLLIRGSAFEDDQSINRRK